jgi:GTPase SAR1 family protein
MKIGMCGTVSVGKTTLVNALKELEQFKDYKFATERSQHLMSLGIPLNTDSTLKGQTVFLAERCGELMHEDIITDRTIIDVMAFTLNAKSIKHQDKDAFETYASEFIREYDYIFYISPEGIPVEDNGVRETNEPYRDKINSTILDLIERHGHKAGKLGVLSGSTEERILQLLHFIQS